jgi:PadR family transcriptional regulator PadR
MVPDRMATNLRKGVLEHCVLALMRDEPRYGVDLSRRLTAVGLLASEGTLYPLLARMREAGLVETEWIESPEGRPRRYYRLTSAGSERLAEFQTVWAPLRDAVDTILEER